MAQSPWFNLPQDNPNAGVGPLSNEALLAMLMPEEAISAAPPKPSVNTTKVMKESRQMASEPQKQSSAWDALQAQILSDFDTRKNDLGALESRISNLPEADPSSFKNMNLKPLLALADQYAGTNFAASYTAPKIDESLRNKLNDQAEKKRQALADDQLKLAAALNKGEQFDRSLLQKMDFTDRFFDAKEDALEIARMRAEAAANGTSGKLPGDAYTMAGFYREAELAENTFNDLAKKGFSPTRAGQARSFLNEAKTKEEQLFEDAVAQFANAKLRPDTGAAATEFEIAEIRKTYFPMAGDSAERIQQKALMRKQIMNNLKGRSRGAEKTMPSVLSGKPQAPAAIQPGHVEDGQVFLGGNPADPNAWKRQ